MEITAQMVKELRTKTGAGMMDCKKALQETNGDFDDAFDYLREKGIARAAKKADRIAAEGLTSIAVSGNTAVIFEVNAETDFVAKNTEFQALVKEIGAHLVAKKPATIDEAMEQKMDSNVTVFDYINGAIAKIGEKITLRRFQILTKSDNDSFGEYLHMGGRISALTVLLGSTDSTVAKDVAMHVAAINPKYLDRSGIPHSELEHEKRILTEQALNEGKPAPIVEKMVLGRLSKYCEEVCLLDQTFVKNPDLKVETFVKNSSGKLHEFVRFEVGEGLEKRQDNFAEEVMNQLKKD